MKNLTESKRTNSYKNFKTIQWKVKNYNVKKRHLRLVTLRSTVSNSYVLTFDQCFTSGNTIVSHCIESMQSYHNLDRINRACCTCCRALNLDSNRSTSRLQAPDCCWITREKTCKISAIHQSHPIIAETGWIYQIKVRGAFWRQQVHQGEQLNYWTMKKWMRRKSTNINPRPVRSHALPVSGSALLHLQDFYGMNYFPGNDQKNSLHGVLLYCSSMFSKWKDVLWCERLLLLPWRNLPSPPQGRNRETTEEGRE